MRTAVAVLFLASTAAAATHQSAPPLEPVVAAAATPAVPVEAVTTTSAPPPPPPVVVTTVAPPPPPPVTAAPVPAAAPRPVAPKRVAPPPTAAPRPLPAVTLRPPAVTAGREPYRGLGTWVDVYDWTVAYTQGKPTVSPADVDAMAGAGVETLYIQASKHDAPGDVVEPELLQAHIDRAQARGIRVVVWYLPTFVDPARDLQRLVAIAALPNIDGLAVDIEARNVADVAERNRRLIELSAALRQALPGRTIGAIVLPPVALEVINPAFWPAFPYRDIAPFYDVWMTMGYWTNRTKASGYRDGYRYTRENIDRLRNNLGQPAAPVHPIGGIGTGTTAADVEGYKRAAAETRSIGGSLYDWHTTHAALWARLRGLRGDGGG